MRGRTTLLLFRHAHQRVQQRLCRHVQRHIAGGHGGQTSTMSPPGKMKHTVQFRCHSTAALFSSMDTYTSPFFGTIVCMKEGFPPFLDRSHSGCGLVPTHQEGAQCRVGLVGRFFGEEMPAVEWTSLHVVGPAAPDP
jgi:hypothetical protein